LPSPPPLRTGRAPFRCIRLKHDTTRREARGEPPWPGGHLHDTRTEPTPEVLRWWQPHQQEPLRPRRHLCFAASRRLAALSRASTPEGSLLPCGQGNIATPIRPITGRPSLPPPSCTRCPLRSSYDFPCCRGHSRATGLPRSAGGTHGWFRSRLFAGGTPSAPEEFGTPGPDHVPFGPSLSASLACPW
jgi:hypothetical protein